MPWFDRFRRGVRGRRAGDRDREASGIAHLEAFLRTRNGVELFLEQPTTMTRASALLVAFDGEWTRRTVPSVAWARDFARRWRIPAYDAGVMGYPQRMRDYNARRRFS